MDSEFREFVEKACALWRDDSLYNEDILSAIEFMLREQAKKFGLEFTA